MAAETLIEARGLTRRYGPNVAVAGVDLRLAQGEILGLLGPNGAGKSTIMKMLTGNLAPSEGEVHIKGISVADDPTAAKKHLGYLPEQPPVYPELTVDEYLDFCATIHGVPRRDRATAVASARADCALDEVRRRLIGNLSKGFQQRVGIAQAIIHRPQVVILDEPTVGLDPNQIREIRALIVDLGRNHTVILSSHILAEIQAVCSRVVIIDRGRIVHDAPTGTDVGAGRIIAGFAREVTPQALQAVPGVSGAEALGGGRFRLTPDASIDPREALVEASVRNGWSLRELRSERSSLEDLFHRLTAGESETPVAGKTAEAA